MSETHSGSSRKAEDVPLPGGDFTLFVQKLGYQALIALGVLENPLTRTRQPNMGHARAVIDDLMMLRDRTGGNLSAEEAQHLLQVVSDLQRHFVALQQREAAGG